ncbi:MAG: ABC transporter substrate-binding protein [Anaerolineae bacterium]|nr:ABC transporter substrate-binding protein [Anaerolineae bacterium]
MMSGQNARIVILVGAVIVVALVIIAVVLLMGNDDGNDGYTVGIVNIAGVLDPVVEGFKEGMAEFGYTDKDITYIYDGPVSRDEHEAALQRLIDQDVDVILSLTTPVTISAKTLTAETGTPVVFVPVTDPISTGIVSELAQPGGNITGIISGQNEEVRLEWLIQVAPDVKRILYPYNPNDASPTNTLAALQLIAPDLGVELVPVETPDVESVQALIDNLPADIDAIFLGPDSLVGSLYPQWVEVSIARKLPTSGSSLAHVEAGILCSYSYSPFEAGKQAAHLVDQILDGADPGALPVEVAEPLSSLNLATANAIGLEMENTLLRQTQVLIRAEE